MIEVRLKLIIDELKRTKTLNSLNISDDVLFSEACSFLRNEFASQNKFNSQQTKVGMNTLSLEKPTINNSSESPMNKSVDNNSDLATKEQLDYIYKNNIDVDTRNLTKKESWSIINEYKKTA